MIKIIISLLIAAAVVSVALIFKNQYAVGCGLMGGTGGAVLLMFLTGLAVDGPHALDR